MPQVAISKFSGPKDLTQIELCLAFNQVDVENLSNWFINQILFARYLGYGYIYSMPISFTSGHIIYMKSH